MHVKGLNSLLTLQKAVQDLETKLEITEQWMPNSADWIETDKMVSMYEYQLALDKLEGLVVAHLFDLTKLNHSGTGK